MCSSRDQKTRRRQKSTWHPAHSLCSNLGEEQGLHPPPVSPALHPRTAGVFPDVEDVFRIFKGDDDGGFGVRRQGGNHAGRPFGDGHFGFGDVGAFSEAQSTWTVFTEVECP